MAPKKKVAAAPAALKKQAAPAKPVNPLYEKRPKTFGIGGALPPKRDMHRFVRWPKYVRIQRQRRVLNQRLKVPPALNRFQRTLDKNTAAALFGLLLKYRPEDKAAKKQRLLKEAEARAAGQEVEKKRPVVVKYGINHITQLVEAGKAQLVAIAHDVDPIELVVWLPALCKKMGVPYVIVKGKARLGQVVHKKTATAVALTAVKNEDQREFAKLVETAKAVYNEGPRVTWGGGIMGPKSQAATKKRERLLAKEGEGSLPDGPPPAPHRPVPFLGRLAAGTLLLLPLALPLAAAAMGWGPRSSTKAATVAPPVPQISESLAPADSGVEQAPLRRWRAPSSRDPWHRRHYEAAHAHEAAYAYTASPTAGQQQQQFEGWHDRAAAAQGAVVPATVPGKVGVRRGAPHGASLAPAAAATPAVAAAAAAAPAPEAPPSDSVSSSSSADSSDAGSTTAVRAGALAATIEQGLHSAQHSLSGLGQQGLEGLSSAQHSLADLDQQGMAGAQQSLAGAQQGLAGLGQQGLAGAQQGLASMKQGLSSAQQSLSGLGQQGLAGAQHGLAGVKQGLSSAQHSLADLGQQGLAGVQQGLASARQGLSSAQHSLAGLGQQRLADVQHGLSELSAASAAAPPAVVASAAAAVLLAFALLFRVAQQQQQVRRSGLEAGEADGSVLVPVPAGAGGPALAGAAAGAATLARRGGGPAELAAVRADAQRRITAIKEWQAQVAAKQAKLRELEQREEAQKAQLQELEARLEEQQGDVSAQLGRLQRLLARQSVDEEDAAQQLEAALSQLELRQRDEEAAAEAALPVPAAAAAVAAEAEAAVEEAAEAAAEAAVEEEEDANPKTQILQQRLQLRRYQQSAAGAAAEEAAEVLAAEAAAEGAGLAADAVLVSAATEELPAVQAQAKQEAVGARAGSSRGSKGAAAPAVGLLGLVAAAVGSATRAAPAPGAAKPWAAADVLLAPAVPLLAGLPKPAPRQADKYDLAAGLGGVEAPPPGAGAKYDVFAQALRELTAAASPDAAARSGRFDLVFAMLREWVPPAPRAASRFDPLSGLADWVPLPSYAAAGGAARYDPVAALLLAARAAEAVSPPVSKYDPFRALLRGDWSPPSRRRSAGEGWTSAGGRFCPLAAVLDAGAADPAAGGWAPPTRAGGAPSRFDAFASVLNTLLQVDPRGAPASAWDPVAWLLDGWAGEWRGGGGGAAARAAPASHSKYDPATAVVAAARAAGDPRRGAGKYDPVAALLDARWVGAGHAGGDNGVRRAGGLRQLFGGTWPGAGSAPRNGLAAHQLEDLAAEEVEVEAEERVPVQRL
eukprot:scaffold2.g7326.t1